MQSTAKEFQLDTGFSKFLLFFLIDKELSIRQDQGVQGSMALSKRYLLEKE